MDNQSQRQSATGVNEEETSYNGDDTPIEAADRRTGDNSIQTNAKPSAKAETGEGGNNGEVAGAPNQGTPKR